MLRRYWADLPLRSKGALVVAIPLLALLLSVALSLTLRQQQVRAQAWVVHSYRVRVTIQNIYTAVAEASTGVRGHLLSGREIFLEPYEQALSELPAGLSSLRTLVGDNPAQGARAQRLTRLVTSEFEFLRRLLDEELEPAARDALLLESKFELDRLRDLLEEMRSEEVQLLEPRARGELAARNLQEAALWLSGLFGLLGGLTAMVLFVDAILRRVQMLGENAVCLSHGRPLEGLPPGGDEIGSLGRELEKTYWLLQASRGELKAQNRALALQQARLAQLATFRQALVELLNASLHDGSDRQFYENALARGRGDSRRSGGQPAGARGRHVRLCRGGRV